MHRAQSLRSEGKRSGFTLIELIAVIAVIAILSTILISTMGGANASAKKAKTRAQFSQWGSAIELFRQEYGYYPTFPNQLVNGDGSTTAQIVQFREVLTGRGTGSGTPPAFQSTTENGSSPQNPKRIQFLSIGQGEFAGELLQDGFGNTVIAVLTDTNYDGMIKIQVEANGGDYVESEVPDLSATQTAPLGTNDIVRTGVLFYSPGLGNSNSDVVKSWE